MKTVIYYFSGTGNSLYVARELQKRLPDVKLISMISLLDNQVINTEAETVGFVFPIYFTAIPMPVKNFIKQLNLQSIKYIFAIVTRIGINHSAFYTIDKLLRKKGKCLDSQFSLNMAGNDPKFDYQVPTKEEIMKLESEVNTSLESISNCILNQSKSRERDTTFKYRIPGVRLLSLLIGLTGGIKEKFYADSKCSGCGTCAKVCLSQKIKMVDDKPVWQDKIPCYHCAACLNFCPMQAVQIQSFTEKNGRYPHPYASVEDIAAQKYSLFH